jgi:hypothetical protein
MAPKVTGSTGDPRFAKGYARDRREDVDTVGRASKLNNTVWCSQVVHGDTQVTKTKARENVENALRVFSIGVDEEIDIARESRVAVKGHGMATDDEVLNVARVEQFDKLAQICLQLRQESSCAAR